ncbi:hypothetical protein BT638P3_00009 [Bacteroides phage BT638P3]|nr:hypothetical protein BT638P3_00009 [Bacteroides phage BT638P3]WAX09627.1 hypothetical protein BT638P4_00016 [Bacteroides phage BT638P4]
MQIITNLIMSIAVFILFNVVGGFPPGLIINLAAASLRQLIYF